MKKNILAIIPCFLILISAGCGDNRTIEKLLGHAMYRPASHEDSVRASVRSLKYISILFGGMTAADSYALTVPEPEYGDFSGIKLTMYDSAGIETYDEEKVKSVKVTGTYSDVTFSFDCDYTGVLDETGDFDLEKGGVRLSGTIKAEEVYEGEVIRALITFRNTHLFHTITSFEFRAGAIDVKISDKLVTYTTSLSFNNDGSAAGTITGTDGYAATVSVNADGTGSYTDSLGTHNFEVEI